MQPRVPIILVILLFFLLYSAIFSQELDFPSSTRSLALGNSYLAITELKNMTNFNPAALAFNERTYLSLDIRSHDYTYEDSFFRTPSNNSEIGLSASIIRDSIGVTFGYRRKGNKYHENIYVSPSITDSQLVASLKKTRRLYHEYYVMIHRGWQLHRNLFLGSTTELLHSASESFWDKNGFFSKNTFSGVVDIAMVVRFNESIFFAIQVKNLLKLNWRYVIIDYWGNRKYLKRLPMRLHLGGRIKLMHSTLLYVDLQDVYTEPLRNGYSFNPSFHLGVKQHMVDMVTIYFGYQVSKFRKNFFLFSEELTHLFSTGMSIEYRDYTLDIAMVFGDRANVIRDFEVKFQEYVIHYLVFGTGNKFSVTLGYAF